MRGIKFSSYIGIVVFHSQLRREGKLSDCGRLRHGYYSDFIAR